MNQKTHRRSLRFDNLRESVDEIQRLRTSGYQMAGNWNLAKACQHLCKSMTMSLEGSPFRLPGFIRPIARMILFHSVMKGVPTRLPLVAPRPFQPDENANEDQEVARYVELVEKVMSDETELIPDHPVFGKVSKPEWQRFHAWHAAHHLSYLLPG